MIRPATLAPASFILANMRPEDHDECMCQVPEGTRTWELAYGMLMGGEGYVAYDAEDRAACFFGTTPMNVAALSVWAVGTRHMQRVVPEVSRFLVRTVVPRRIEQGYQIMEARSHAMHLTAHRWMMDLGAQRVGQPFVFGRSGELFHLFRWTAAAFPRIAAQRRYSRTTSAPELVDAD
jgi:hypothetical protein